MKTVIHNLILATLFLYCLPVAAQVRPDYQNIERVTKDTTHAYFYPKLIERYEHSDTTLTNAEFHVLYYGYFFQDGYDAYHPEVYKDSINALYKKGNITKEERKTAIRLLYNDLRYNPFNLSDLNRLATIYYDAGDAIHYNQCRFKFRGIGQVILASGDGKSEEKGFHVLTVSDEYTMLSALGLKYKNHKTNTITKCDYLEVEENSQGVQGLYFDVKQIFEGYLRVKDPRK